MGLRLPSHLTNAKTAAQQHAHPCLAPLSRIDTIPSPASQLNN